MPEIVPMLLGDFVCCLRSALDHLAWQLAHLEMREFTERELREIQFPVARLDDGKYRHTLSLFPSTVTDDIDELQPYHRGDGEEYRDDLLWQLSELWRIDKHRLIAINSNSYNVGFPLPVEMWQPFIKHFDHTIEVQLPLGLSWTCPVDLEPTVSVEVLFGEYMGELCISRERLGEINQFVRDTVIPRFARFFP